MLLIVPFFMDCNNKPQPDKPKIITENVVFNEEVDDVPPPPPGLVSNFKSLQDWLFKICDRDKPGKSIMTYNFGLFESPGNYTIFLVGLNQYEKKNSLITRIEFEPKSMYFRLPETEYKNLNREQLVDKLTAQLKDFTKTEKFKTSFLAKAKSITTDFKGEIWKN